jgi:hypothetical protein
MLTILQELNIDCFQGYGNSYCKECNKANQPLQATLESMPKRRCIKACVTCYISSVF